MDTDKQYYRWFEDNVEHRYHTPAYGIANLPLARSAMEKFLEENFAGYIEGHMRNATEITRTTFQTAQEHKVRSPPLESSDDEGTSSANVY